MFRNAARVAVRVASAQQKRMNSTGPASSSGGRSAVFAGAVFAAGAVAVALAGAQQNPTQNAFFSSPLDLKKARADIISAIEAEDAKRGDGTSIGPTLVRLAWHASGTYSIHDKTGGSNGATMRFKPESDWGANAGLSGARAFMEGITKKHPQLSTADAWTLAAGK